MMSQATSRWLTACQKIDDLKQASISLREALDRAESDMAAHVVELEAARSEEFCLRRELQRFLVNEVDRLAALDGTDSRPEEGTAAHFDRYIAGDR